MWKGGSQNTDSHWDNIPNIMYEILFYEADNIQQIYRDQGLPVPEYHIHGNSHSYRDNYGSSTYLGEYSGITSDEALARHLQEIENDFHNFSLDETPFRTGDRGVSQVGPSFLDEYQGIQDDVNPEEMTYEVGNISKSALKSAVATLNKS
ncbi:hypothetical protein REPUB_Repub07fG0128900 [Reevesia pubescens]